MNNTPLPVDITHITNADFIHLVKEMNATHRPRVLKIENKPVAMLIPVMKIKKTKKEQTKKNYKAFHTAAGSWSDVDVEKFKKDIYRSRQVSISSSGESL